MDETIQDQLVDISSFCRIHWCIAFFFLHQWKLWEIHSARKISMFCATPAVPRPDRIQGGKVKISIARCHDSI